MLLHGVCGDRHVVPDDFCWNRRVVADHRICLHRSSWFPETPVLPGFAEYPGLIVVAVAAVADFVLRQPVVPDPMTVPVANSPLKILTGQKMPGHGCLFRRQFYGPVLRHRVSFHHDVAVSACVNFGAANHHGCAAVVAVDPGCLVGLLKVAIFHLFYWFVCHLIQREKT